MSREVTLEVPMEVPNCKTESVHLRMWLESVRSQVGGWGRDGRNVGVGYTWYTRRGISNARLPSVTRRIKRALKSSFIVDRLCDPYNLEQKIVYVRDGEGRGRLVLKEG